MGGVCSWRSMKPAVSQEALQTALVIIGSMLTGLSLVPLDGLVAAQWLPIAQVIQHSIGIAAALLTGKEAFPRRTDFTPRDLPHLTRKSVPNDLA